MTLPTSDTVLTPFECAVLERIQGDFPLDADPYAEIARQLGSTRDAVHAAVRGLRERRIIRRIGGSFSAAALGYVSTLVAARVRPDCLEAVAACVGACDEVTHSYQRAGRYNLWFTVIAREQARVDEIVDLARRLDGVDAVESLPASRVFKIRVDFTFQPEGRHAGCD